MAPLRRYLRITKYSVLEVRIYLDNPAELPWLTDSRGDVLPRIFQAIKPYVLPKLREEFERAKGSKNKRPKGVKDTVIGDDFEVGIFLVEQSIHHALLTKRKDFRGDKSRLKSNSGKLTGWLEHGTDEEPIAVEDDEARTVQIREESDEEDVIGLSDASRARTASGGDPIEIDDDVSEDEGFQTQRDADGAEDASKPTQGAGDGDDKKKLGLETVYDGFGIYGRVLCLVVKRKGGRARAGGQLGEQAPKMLESWVSTQAAQDNTIRADDYD